MKKLIILAHPSSKGTARKLAEAYLESAKTKGHEVKFIDLYHEPRQEYLTFESVREPVKDALQDAYKAQISWAEEISFFMPMWWMNPPAIMKNFFDVNFSAGFAFKYSPKGQPIGLLNGRSARTFMTCDGPAWIYGLLLMPFRTIWNLSLKFCGIKVLSFKLYDKVRLRTEAEKNQWYQTIQLLN